MSNCPKTKGNNSFHERTIPCVYHSRHRKDWSCGEKKCHCDEKLFKECFSIEWSVPHGATQTIYQTGGLERLLGSGYVSFDCGSPQFVNLRFFLGNVQVGSTTQIFEESSTAFSYTRFDRIEVTCPPFVGPPDPDCPDRCEGELFIKTAFNF